MSQQQIVRKATTGEPGNKGEFGSKGTGEATDVDLASSHDDVAGEVIDSREITAEQEAELRALTEKASASLVAASAAQTRMRHLVDQVDLAAEVRKHVPEAHYIGMRNAEYRAEPDLYYACPLDEDFNEIDMDVNGTGLYLDPLPGVVLDEDDPDPQPELSVETPDRQLNGMGLSGHFGGRLIDVRKAGRVNVAALMAQYKRDVLAALREIPTDA